MNDEDLPHAAGSASCNQCGHLWTAVWPLGAENLQCPRCDSTDTEREAVNGQ